VYFIIIAGVAVVSMAFTLPMTPYPNKFGEKTLDFTVKAVGEMWSWSLSADWATHRLGANLCCRSASWWSSK
jgi:heme/copper-type cytochrome/quinol oxidase subunit 2